MASEIKVDNIKDQCGTAVITKCGATHTVTAEVYKADTIQDTSGNAYIAKCGSTITLGGCGQTLVLAAGTTNELGGGVDWDTTAKTSNFNAVAGKGYFVDTTSNTVTVTLPTGVAGESVTILDYVANANTNAIIVTPQSGEKIEGGTSGQGVTLNRQALTLTYSGTAQGWLVSNAGDSGPIAGATITFTTASGSLGTIAGPTERAAPNSNLSPITASTTFGTLSYSIQSGSLPSGLTINSSTGAFVGTATEVLSSTESSFTVRATLTETGQTEDRAFTITVGPDAAYITATGGSITTSGDYKIHVFTGPGTFTVTCAGNPGGSDTVTAAVLAGAGGAGSFYGGGGGGGGLVVDSDGFTVSATGYPITVGGGGNGPTGNSNPGVPGSNSTALGYTAIGGGHGGGGSGGAEAGGSGGGGGGSTPGNTTGTQPSQSNPGATNYGNPGGPHPQGSGGGGAGSSGSNGPSGSGGSAFNVSPVVGPAPAIPNSGVYARGGNGQGGGTAGGANTGNGGYGDNFGPQPGNGRGGSGVVIIKYKYQN